jgi:transglutaminase-like putative cysteine protease
MAQPRWMDQTEDRAMDALATPYPLARYTEESVIIDWSDPAIASQAAAIQQAARDELHAVRASFEWVRDRVAHSWDIQGRRVTARASEVMREREGICYAKSHLLAALLRAQGIPSGICYQRLTLYDDPTDGFVVHALNTVWLASLERWIRLDARGNRPGVDAQFSLHKERLAFPVRPELGEVDYRVNLPEPHPLVLATLAANSDAMAMYQAGLPAELSFSV